MDIHEGLRKQLAEFGYESPDDGWDAFLRGFASIGDLYGILAPRPKPYKPMTDEEINAAVAEDFRQAWEAVGRDMQSALDDYGREIAQSR